MHTFKLIDSDEVLSSARLQMRLLRHQDAAALLALYSDPLVIAHTPLDLLDSLPAAEAYVAAVIENFIYGNYCWVLIHQQDLAIIGTISLPHVDRQGLKAEIGYTLAVNYWGQGLATEAVKIIVDYCFTDLGLWRLEAYLLPENVASVRVLEKNGFRCEGFCRQFTQIRRRWRGVLKYSLLRCERTRAVL
jgi:RimJ/RimL family protein N-acetyltransferase